MRSLGAAFVLLSALYYGFTVFTPLNRFHAVPDETLARDFKNVSAELAQHDRLGTLPVDGMEALDRMRSEKAWIGMELKRRTIGAEKWIPAFSLAGIGLILFSFVRLPSRREEDPAAPDPGREIREAAPREVYADEFEFQRRRESGFASRNEALEWILKDPLRKCDYCGAEMRPTFAGDREAIELVTFYKKVPDGAKDLRVVLGSYWFVKSATELKCVGCERVIRR